MEITMLKKNLGLVIYFLGLFVFTLALTFTIGKTKQRRIALNQADNLSGWRKLASSASSSDQKNIKSTPQQYVLSATDTQSTETIEEQKEDVEQPKKQSYTIALFGDSMVETMGDSGEYLKEELIKKYPNTRFAIYNYGIGSENVEEATQRLDQPYNESTKHYSPLKELSPDILLLGSFAYNPITTENPDLYWSKLAELISNVKKITQNVYLLAEIGPLYYGFGSGPGGVNWPEDKAREQSQKIKKNLENAMGLARITDTNLIDAYTPSLKKSGIVDPKYVSTHDHIHPSIEGHTFMAKIIADTLKLD